MPLLSVVIPTYRRPTYLIKAIRSALLSAPNDDVEVLVVPNGGGNEWVDVAKVFEDDRRVQWLPLLEANVSAARNHGLAAAEGKYVRFLDVDDYFFEEACRRQVDAALAAEADVCSGAIAIVDHGGWRSRNKYQPETEDICVAACGPARLVKIGAHLFKLELAQ